MSTSKHLQPYWVSSGKTVRVLVAELNAIENQDLEVRVALGNGAQHMALSVVKRRGDLCLLLSSE